MRISPKLHGGDIGTTLALTPSEAGPRRQQTLLQVRAREEGFSVDHNIPTLPQASPICICLGVPVHREPLDSMLQVPSSGLTRDATRLKKFTWVPGAPLDFQAHGTNSGQPVF